MILSRMAHVPTNMEAEEADDVEEDGEDIGGEPDWVGDMARRYGRRIGEGMGEYSSSFLFGLRVRSGLFFPF